MLEYGESPVIYNEDNYMKIKDLSEFHNSELAGLLGRIPFFKELQQRDTQQLDVLLNYSCIVELDPGETIMRRGDRGSWLYFLIKGRLAVYLGNPVEGSPLNYITPGELFGDLALLCNHERKATVASEPSGRNVVLFATDFKPFGDLSDFGQVSLMTKLLFYRTMVHSIRWRLEQKRLETRDEQLAQELRHCPVYQGMRDTMDELQTLHAQAQFLADALDRWNSVNSGVQDLVVTPTSTSY